MLLGPIERFDQRNDISRRARYDPKIMRRRAAFDAAVPDQNKPGYTQEDFALTAAAWHLEDSCAKGTSGSNHHGLYAWEPPTPELVPGEKADVSDPAANAMALVAGLLAQFVRGLGYKAIPCGNDTALSTPIAIEAGLGELGRNGILIPEKFGLRVRLCKVFTDLPLATDEPHFSGVEEFCRICMKCADDCPSRAIPFEEQTTEAPKMSNTEKPVPEYTLQPVPTLTQTAAARLTDTPAATRAPDVLQVRPGVYTTQDKDKGVCNDSVSSFWW